MPGQSNAERSDKALSVIDNRERCKVLEAISGAHPDHGDLAYLTLTRCHVDPLRGVSWIVREHPQERDRVVHVLGEIESTPGSADKLHGNLEWAALRAVSAGDLELAEEVAATALRGCEEPYHREKVATVWWHVKQAKTHPVEFR